MTAQEIFNTVLFGLRGQAERSTLDDGRCAYRGTQSRKCAAGFLIPDDIYVPDMEGKSISALLWRYDSLAHLIQHEILIQTLQYHHDDMLPVGMNVWEARMRSTAAFYELEYTEPVETIS